MTTVPDSCDFDELPPVPPEVPETPFGRLARRIGLMLGLVWLVACFAALSGKCDRRSFDQPPAGALTVPSPTPESAPRGNEQ